MSWLEKLADRWTPEPNTGCYLWTGAIANGAGHGRVSVSWKKQKLVSRLVLEEAIGPPPAGKPHALHNTRNGCVGGPCINPDHLRWGTHLENMRDILPADRSEQMRRANATRKAARP
jgi:hypothetical protein